jgi:hypothetical protein
LSEDGIDQLFFGQISFDEPLKGEPHIGSGHEAF